jgi:hypothetical protein
MRQATNQVILCLRYAFVLATYRHTISNNKAQLMVQKLICNLFETTAFIRHLEAAYADIDERQK